MCKLTKLAFKLLIKALVVVQYRFYAIVLIVFAASGISHADASKTYPGIGRPAKPAEIAAWDIDVRPDFKGLPKGQGTVAKGEAVWEAKCASCHGAFGESNTIFNPIVGGQKKSDMATGRVASLASDAPERSTLSKLSQVSTLWDYINRAMPWNAPKTLSVEEVYAVTAYVLHLGDILPADFTLSDANIRSVQQLIPNRNGMQMRHALWSDKPGAPDAKGSACMSNCKVGAAVASLMPDYAKNAHGNLAEQSRLIGATRGNDTSKYGVNKTATASKAPVAAVTRVAVAATAKATGADVNANLDLKAINLLLASNSCTACHAPEAKLVGPSWAQVTQKYAARSDGAAYLSGKIAQGGQGVWGAIPMPAQALSAAQAQLIAAWLVAGAKR